MISYFPSIYPDELLYSQLARYYAKSGYLAYTFAANDLFESKTTRPDIEFLNAYTQEALRMITGDISLQDVIMHHTMFPYYGRFIRPERRKQAFDSLVSMGIEYKNLLSIPKRKDCIARHLRYCPLCVDADRNSYGETYWHRSHQMVGVNICPIHHCRLIDTDITTSSKASPSLIAAEQVVYMPEEITFSDNALEYRLAEYIAEVFLSDVDLKSVVTTGQFLHSRMENTKYLSLRGEQRNMTLLHTDFSMFYSTLPQNEFNQQWQLQKVFTNDRYNTHEICMLAMFLNIPVSDLVHMTLPEKAQQYLFDAKIKELHRLGLNYQQIADELHASYNVVKAIGEGKYGTYHYYSDNPRKGGAKKFDWKSIDSATLPLVKDAICKLYGDGISRPVQITIGTVERYIGLPKKGLQHCPECRKEIQKHCESQEEYWARKMVWAANSLIRNDKPLHLTNIKKLTNMRDSYILACLPYLDKYGDAEITHRLKVLVE